MLQYTNGLTSNYNNYSAIELEKALQSWVEPYPKPIILNHDLNTEPIGRVIAAKMDKEEDGSPFVRLQIAITDPVAAQKVLDKRYLTGSVGGRAGKAVCSISGEDLASESDNGRPKVPKYRRGQVYKGKLAYIDMQDISFKEYSFVNQPADGKSSVRSTSVLSDKDGKPNTEGWVAKSSAFVLSMNEEDIYSIEEHDSLFRNMKKKESKPIYLHLKGAFLTALAFQESENADNKAVSLLSSEEAVNNTDLQENSNMKDRNQEEDILAVTEELNQDLSSIAADKTEESDGGEEEAPEAQAEGGEEAGAEDAGEEKSDGDAEKADEQAEEAVDSEQAAESEEPKAEEEKAEGNQEQEGADEDLSDKAEQPAEQDNDVLGKIKALEEENAKLKAALHRILVERVVDAKINAGVEAAEQRDELIKSHSTRTASSLADSLRDIAKLPVRKSHPAEGPEIHNESAAVASEGNVATIDDDNEIKGNKEEVPVEQVFVDALMGRRKL